MNKKTVLFVCEHNSARSQMAEAFLNMLAKDKFKAESAGLQAGQLNPVAVQVMKEIDIDISNNRTESVDKFYNEGKSFDYVITVCDETSTGNCLVFTSAKKTIHWNFENPSTLKGTDEEKLKTTRNIRDKIKSKIESWLIEKEQ